MNEERKQIMSNVWGFVGMAILLVACAAIGGVILTKLVAPTFWLWRGLCFFGGCGFGVIGCTLISVFIDWYRDKSKSPELYAGLDTDPASADETTEEEK